MFVCVLGQWSWIYWQVCDAYFQICFGIKTTLSHLKCLAKIPFETLIKLLGIEYGIDLDFFSISSWISFFVSFRVFQEKVSKFSKLLSEAGTKEIKTNEETLLNIKAYNNIQDPPIYLEQFMQCPSSFRKQVFFQVCMLSLEIWYQ